MCDIPCSCAILVIGCSLVEVDIFNDGSDLSDDERNRTDLKVLADRFNEADQDGSGELNMEEFLEAMRSVQAYASMTDDELRLLFMKVDANSDGTVDWDEFSTYNMLLAYAANTSTESTSSFRDLGPSVPFPEPSATRLRRVANIGLHRSSISHLIAVPAVNTKRLTAGQGAASGMQGGGGGPPRDRLQSGQRPSRDPSGAGGGDATSSMHPRLTSKNYVSISRDGVLCSWNAQTGEFESSVEIFGSLNGDSEDAAQKNGSRYGVQMKSRSGRSAGVGSKGAMGSRGASTGRPSRSGPWMKRGRGGVGRVGGAAGLGIGNTRRYGRPSPRGEQSGTRYDPATFNRRMLNPVDVEATVKRLYDVRNQTSTFVSNEADAFLLEKGDTSSSRRARKTSQWVMSACHCGIDVGKIAIGSDDRRISFVDVGSWEVTKSIELDNVPLTLAAFPGSGIGQDEPALLIGDDAGSVYVHRNIVGELARGSTGRATVSMGQAGMDESYVGGSGVVEDDWVAARERDRQWTFGAMERWDIHSDWVTCVAPATHIHDSWVLSSSLDGRLKISDVERGRVERVLYCDANARGISTFAVAPSQRIIATCGFTRDVLLWRPFIPKPAARLSGHSARVVGVWASPHDELLFTLAADSVIKVWDLRVQKVLCTIDDKSLQQAEDPRSTVCYDDMRDCIVVGTSRLSRSYVQRLLREGGYKSHSTPVTSLLYNNEFHQVVSADELGSVSVWEFNTGTNLMTFHRAHSFGNEGAAVTSMVFDGGERRLITGGRDGKCRVWNFNSGACLKEMVKPSNAEITGVCYVAANSAEEYVVGVGWDCQVSAWLDNRNASGNLVQAISRAASNNFSGHTDDVLAVAFGPPSYLVTGSYQGAIIVWNFDSGMLRHSLRDVYRSRSSVESAYLRKRPQLMARLFALQDALLSAKDAMRASVMMGTALPHLEPFLSRLQTDEDEEAECSPSSTRRSSSDSGTSDQGLRGTGEVGSGVPADGPGDDNPVSAAGDPAVTRPEGVAPHTGESRPGTSTGGEQVVTDDGAPPEDGQKLDRADGSKKTPGEFDAARGWGDDGPAMCESMIDRLVFLCGGRRLQPTSLKGTASPMSHPTGPPIVDAASEPDEQMGSPSSSVEDLSPAILLSEASSAAQLPIAPTTAGGTTGPSGGGIKGCAPVLVSSGEDSLLRFWDPREGVLLFCCSSWMTPDAAISCMITNGNGNWLAVGDNAGLVNIFDVSQIDVNSQGQEFDDQCVLVSSFPAHCGKVTGVAFAGDDFVLTAGTCSTVRLYTMDGRQVGVFGTDHSSWSLEHPSGWYGNKLYKDAADKGVLSEYFDVFLRLAFEGEDATTATRAFLAGREIPAVASSSGASSGHRMLTANNGTSNAKSGGVHSAVRPYEGASRSRRLSMLVGSGAPGSAVMDADQEVRSEWVGFSWNTALYERRVLPPPDMLQKVSRSYYRPPPLLHAVNATTRRKVCSARRIGMSIAGATAHGPSVQDAPAMVHPPCVGINDVTGVSMPVPVPPPGIAPPLGLRSRLPSRAPSRILSRVPSRAPSRAGSRLGGGGAAAPPAGSEPPRTPSSHSHHHAVPPLEELIRERGKMRTPDAVRHVMSTARTLKDAGYSSDEDVGDLDLHSSSEGASASSCSSDSSSGDSAGGSDGRRTSKNRSSRFSSSQSASSRTVTPRWSRSHSRQVPSPGLTESQRAGQVQREKRRRKRQLRLKALQEVTLAHSFFDQFGRRVNLFGRDEPKADGRNTGSSRRTPDTQGDAAASGRVAGQSGVVLSRDAPTADPISGDDEWAVEAAGADGVNVKGDDAPDKGGHGPASSLSSEKEIEIRFFEPMRQRLELSRRVVQGLSTGTAVDVISGKVVQPAGSHDRSRRGVDDGDAGSDGDGPDLPRDDTGGDTGEEVSGEGGDGARIASSGASGPVATSGRGGSRDSRRGLSEASDTTELDSGALLYSIDNVTAPKVGRVRTMCSLAFDAATVSGIRRELRVVSQEDPYVAARPGAAVDEEAAAAAGANPGARVGAVQSVDGVIEREMLRWRTDDHGSAAHATVSTDAGTGGEAAGASDFSAPSRQSSSRATLARGTGLDHLYYRYVEERFVAEQLQGLMSRNTDQDSENVDTLEGEVGDDTGGRNSAGSAGPAAGASGDAAAESDGLPYSPVVGMPQASGVTGSSGAAGPAAEDQTGASGGDAADPLPSSVSRGHAGARGRSVRAKSPPIARTVAPPPTGGHSRLHGMRAALESSRTADAFDPVTGQVVARSTRQSGGLGLSSVFAFSSGSGMDPAPGDSNEHDLQWRSRAWRGPDRNSRNAAERLKRRLDHHIESSHKPQAQTVPVRHVRPAVVPKLPMLDGDEHASIEQLEQMSSRIAQSVTERQRVVAREVVSSVGNNIPSTARSAYEFMSARTQRYGA